MIQDVHPGSGFFPIPDPGVKKAPDPGSTTLVRYTVYSNVPNTFSLPGICLGQIAI
jgi:hypothetical protein